MLGGACLKRLQADLDRNVSMICMHREYPLPEVVYDGQGVMLRYISDDAWCHFSSDSEPEFFQRFMRTHPGPLLAVIAGQPLSEWILRRYRVKWFMYCNRLFASRTFSDFSDPEIEPLFPEHLPLVFQFSKYQQFLNLPYLTTRLAFGGGFCIRVNGTPVAWIMSHDDGSVGMLHVLDEYRGRGFARRLVKAMTQKVALSTCPVFAHVEPSNYPSLCLFKSLGYEERSMIMWTELTGELLNSSG
ncbi:MAG TPA: GNAT family N-acetyltransferase [Lentimicrobium sp.]|nr:GNAT family N-acetyltransferase [Lentimicrobium sp.]